MNALAPPKTAGGTANAARSKLNSMQILFPSSAAIKRVWQREAERLFREFWRSGDRKHLQAFGEQVLGMRSRER